MGVRFQLTPKSRPNDFIIHISLHDQDAKLQQETVGIIGANLLHACFNDTDPKEILKKLYNNTSRASVEINMVEVLALILKMLIIVY